MLELRKKGNKHWLLIDEEIGEFTPSKFTINRLNNIINIVYFNNLKSKEYNVSDCYIFDIDDTSGFNTSNGVAFMDKLEDLNCPCFQKDVNNFYISGGSWSELTNFDALNDATLPLSGAEQIPIVQGGETKKVAVSEFQTDVSGKLDKVSTSGVERAYIINADGSQGTKPTSDFKDVIEGYFNGTNFYTDSGFTNLITPESGKIYINLSVTPATQYRWSGSAYVQIGGGGSDIEDNMHKEWMSVQARYDLGGVFTLNMAVLVASGTQALVSRSGTSLYGSLSLQNYVTSTATGQNAGLKENNVAHGSIRQGFDAFFMFANNSTDNQHMTTVGSYSLVSAIPNLPISSFTGDFFGVGNDVSDTNLSFYAHRVTASGQTASYVKVDCGADFPAHTTTDAYLLRLEAPQTEVEADRFIKMTLTNIITGISVSHTFSYTETPVLNRNLVPVINRNNRNSGTATNIRFGKYNLVKNSY